MKLADERSPNRDGSRLAKIGGMAKPYRRAQKRHDRQVAMMDALREWDERQGEVRVC